MWIGLSDSREMKLRCILEGKSLLEMHLTSALETILSR